MSGRTKCDCAASRVLHERGCASLATPTPAADAVAQARKALDASFASAMVAIFPIRDGATQKHSQCVDALIAAVRAECAAKVRARAELMSPYDRVWVEQTIAALEAQP